MTAQSSTESVMIDGPTWRRGRIQLLAVGSIAIVCCFGAFFVEPRRLLFSYLTAVLFFVTLGWGAMFFVCMHHLTGAVWAVSLRRLMEGVMMTLLPAAIAFVPLLFGLSELYEWTHSDVVAADALLSEKRGYLNQPFFLFRTLVYFGVWGVGALLLYRRSVEQDRASGGDRHEDVGRWSGPILIATFVTVTFASFDWLMSLEPHWYSAVFGVYVYSGSVVGFVAVLILIVQACHAGGKLREIVHVEHQHDLGRWLFALTTFWAYIAFSQYLLIWYANIPEETVWFQKRLEDGWRVVAQVLVIGHFAVPFFVLMSRRAKRNQRVLVLTAGWVLLMHYLDLYWIIMPAMTSSAWFHWSDAAALVAIGGVVGSGVWWLFRDRPLVAVGDSRLAESVALRRAE